MCKGRGERANMENGMDNHQKILAAEEVLRKLEVHLRRAEKPARYTGGELYQAEKDPGQELLRFAFAFPDLYEIGMACRSFTRF